ncbi:MAG: apolipoprotein N-acyltransferase [Pontiellaceae bacterium]|nr:apolipoprotein N-acyltransferase [Pontiellaceae bacterium]
MKLPIRIALAVLSGALLPLCFPAFGWWPVILLVFPPLLLAVKNTTARSAYYLGMTQGIVGYAGALFWFFNIFSVPAIALHLILSIFTGFFCLLYNSLEKQSKSAALNLLLAATLWTGFEFYRSELFFLRFPWITPGTALGPSFLSPIIGTYGTSFLIIAAGAGLVYRKTLPTGIILSACIIGLGVFHPKPVEPDKENSITVTVVQSEECNLPDYVELSRAEHSKNPDLIIWPEYALPYDVREMKDHFSTLTNLCAEMNITLLLGTKTTLEPESRGWHNTALLLNQHGVLGEYYKARPVHFFNDGIPGRDFSPMQTDLGTFSTPICFDCDYTEVARKMVSLGAEFFAALSFDAQHWSTAQHLQHQQLFRLRAAENARWIACAASSGVSQIIDPHGCVHQSIPPMETGAVTGRITPSTYRTFFTRAGWLFPWITFAATLILIVFSSIRKIVERKLIKKNPELRN